MYRLIAWDGSEHKFSFKNEVKWLKPTKWVKSVKSKNNWILQININSFFFRLELTERFKKKTIRWTVFYTNYDWSCSPNSNDGKDKFIFINFSSKLEPSQDQLHMISCSISHVVKMTSLDDLLCYLRDPRTERVVLIDQSCTTDTVRQPYQFRSINL